MVGRLQPDMLDATAIQTSGVVYCLFHFADTSRSEAKANYSLKYLKRIAMHGVGFLSSAGGGCAFLPDGRSLALTAAGVCNLKETMAGVHKGVVTGMETAWNEMKDGDLLSTSFANASLIDLVSFLAQARKLRRMAGRHKWSKQSAKEFEYLLWAMVKFLSAIIKNRCRGIQTALGAELLHRAIPSRKKKLRRGDANPETCPCLSIVS